MTYYVLGWMMNCINSHAYIKGYSLLFSITVITDINFVKTT